MKLRRIGLFLIGLAVLIGTPIAISFIDLAQISCPAPANFPEGRSGEDRRFIDRGAIVRERVVDEGVQEWWRSHGRGSPLEVRWEFSDNRVHVNIPIWPVPTLLAVAGVCCLWSARDRQFNVRTTTLGQRALIALSAYAAIAATSVVMLSFASSGGASVAWPVIKDRVSMRAVGAERGAVFVEYWRDANHLSHAPSPHRGPLSFGLHRFVGAWQFSAPLWPLPLALFGVSWWMHRRATRARRWVSQDRCPSCGYPLEGLVAPACPECGSKLSWNIASSVGSGIRMSNSR